MTNRPTAVSEAGANIAFVKYWGNRSDALRIPQNSSVSMTLAECRAKTEVRLDADLAQNSVFLNGARLEGAALARVQGFLDHVRSLSQDKRKAEVRSANRFPTGCGIASSAAGFAALAVAAAKAYGLNLEARDLSRLARRGSGSACRSVHGGFVEWRAGDGDETSCAEQVAPAAHWPELRDVVAIVSKRHKETGSSDGHKLAGTSPLFPARVASVPESIERVRRAILSRDLTLMGDVIEHEAMSLHAIAMTSRPQLIYWEPETVALLHAVRSWRARGLEAYFTMDAGPNVHIIALEAHVPDLLSELGERGVEAIVDRAGEGAALL